MVALVKMTNRERLKVVNFFSLLQNSGVFFYDPYIRFPLPLRPAHQPY